MDLKLQSHFVSLTKVEILTSDEEHDIAASAGQPTDTADEGSSSGSSDHENDQKKDEPTVQALISHQESQDAGPEE